MTDKAKCPKCGEIEQVEITKTWGGPKFKAGVIMAVSETPLKLEIYCNTCGKVSIIDAEIVSHTSSATE